MFSLLTAEQNVRFLQAAAARDWYPICCMPGDLVGRQLLDAPRGFDRRIFLIVWQLAVAVAGRHPRI